MKANNGGDRPGRLVLNWEDLSIGISNPDPVAAQIPQEFGRTCCGAELQAKVCLKSKNYLAGGKNGHDFSQQ